MNVDRIREAPSDGTRPLVRVLVACYNGERFVGEQLDTVIQQRDVNVQVLIRDDGSHDGSLRILREYEARHANVRVLSGENIGAAANFLRLLNEPPEQVGYFAFCGHDDLWHPDKLARALSWLMPTPSASPAAYCGRQRLVDVAGVPFGMSKLPTRRLSFENALVENPVAGGTLVINQALRELVLEGVKSHHILWEDWWTYLVVSAFGKVSYDPEPFLDYRFHGTNAVAASTIAQRWRNAKRLMAPRAGEPSAPELQASTFRQLFGGRLDRKHSELLDRYLDKRPSPMRLIKRAITLGVRRQSPLDELAVRLLMSLGRL